MYVELSPRQTGKTNRLIAAVRSELHHQLSLPVEQRKTLVVVCASEFTAEHIRNNVLSLNVPGVVRGTVELLLNVVYKQQDYDQIKEFYGDRRLFVDNHTAGNIEFELMQDGYYCATDNPGDPSPMSLRLIDMNRGNSVTHHGNAHRREFNGMSIWE